jgi:hypothetical protein
LATAQPFGQITVRDDREKTGKPGRRGQQVSGAALRPGVCCCRCSILLSMASRRLSMTAAARGRHQFRGRGSWERLVKLLMFVLCMIFVAQRHQAVRRLSMQMKLVTSFPILALLLFPLSQLATRTISSGALLLGAILLLYYIMSRYAFDEVLELFLILARGRSWPVLCLPWPFRSMAWIRWVGILIRMEGRLQRQELPRQHGAVFLTVAVSYRGRTSSCVPFGFRRSSFA